MTRLEGGHSHSCSNSHRHKDPIHGWRLDGEGRGWCGSINFEHIDGELLLELGTVLADSTDVPLLPRAGERDSVLSAHQGQGRIWLDDAFLESRLVHLEDVVVRRWVLEYCKIITEVDVISLCQRMNLVLVYVHLSIVNAYLGTIHRLRLFAKGKVSRCQLLLTERVADQGRLCRQPIPCSSRWWSSPCHLRQRAA